MVAVALLVAAYVALPWYSAVQLAEAAHNEEIERFRDFVDVPAVRANLKANMQQGLRDSMGSDAPAELSEFLSAGANLFLGPLLEGLVSAESLAALLRGGDALWQFERELSRPGADGAPRGRATAGESDDLQLIGWHFTGFDRVAADYGAAGRSELRLVLERQGLHWRVVDLRFPEPRQENGSDDENG